VLGLQLSHPSSADVWLEVPQTSKDLQKLLSLLERDTWLKVEISLLQHLWNMWVLGSHGYKTHGNWDCAINQFLCPFSFPKGCS